MIRWRVTGRDEYSPEEWLELRQRMVEAEEEVESMTMDITIDVIDGVVDEYYDVRGDQFPPGWNQYYFQVDNASALKILRYVQRITKSSVQQRPEHLLGGPHHEP